jgi:endonuclease-3
MTSTSRTALFGKIHKVLKKYYKPSAPLAERSVLEHLLFACVLEDTHPEAAEEAFAALRHTFFDWNEVRVTSISELSEVMAVLPDPRAAANRVKRVLHSIFEELYGFDLEDKRKKNLGPTVKWLEKMDGTTRFVVAYVIQAALGGHSIPVDQGTRAALGVLDLVGEKDAVTGEVPGMERAVGKSKGAEFASLLHQLGADYLANPFSPQVREILLAIDPEASKRFPQRRQPRPEPAPAPLEPPASGSPAVTPRRKKAEAAAPAKPAAAEAETADGTPAEAAIVESKAAESKPADGKKAVASAGKKAAEASSQPPAAEKPHDKHAKAEKAEKADKSPKAEKPEKAEKHEKRSVETAKTSLPADGLGKRKPR